MDKKEFTTVLSGWLENYLKSIYSKTHNIEIVIPSSNFSKISNEKLKKIDGYTSFDFHTDLLGILENKKNNNVELVILNRSTSAVSLKEIGEMNCYSKLIKPKHCFIASLKGLPEEVNLILLSKDKEEKILKITKDLYITIFKWDESKNKIDPISIFPINERNKFY